MSNLTINTLIPIGIATPSINLERPVDSGTPKAVDALAASRLNRLTLSISDETERSESDDESNDSPVSSPIAAKPRFALNLDESSPSSSPKAAAPAKPRFALNLSSDESVSSPSSDDFDESVLHSPEVSVESPYSAALKTHYQRFAPESTVSLRALSPEHHAFIRSLNHQIGTNQLEIIEANNRGLYFLVEKGTGKKVAIFKPDDEVRGGKNARKSPNDNLAGKDGILPQNENRNGVIVSLLNSRSPITVQMTLAGEFWNSKLQKPNNEIKKGLVMPFIEHARSLSEHKQLHGATPLTAQAVQDLSLIDFRFLNTDRNEGNVLLRNNPDGTTEIIPIDHASIAPAGFASSGVYCWTMSEASHQAYSPEMLAQIEGHDFAKDAQKILAYAPDYPVGSLETMEISYTLLKKAAAKGLTPFQIAWFTRSDSGMAISFMLKLYQDAKTLYPDDPEKAMQFISSVLDKAIDAMKNNKAVIDLFAKVKANPNPNWSINARTLNHGLDGILFVRDFYPADLRAELEKLLS